MKPLQTLLAALLLASVTAHGTLYPINSGTLNTSVLDANPTGISSTLNASGLRPIIEDVNVWFNVTGGANGDLYAFLSHDGVLVPLVNRVGTGSGDAIQTLYGYSTSGFGTVKLDDQATATGNIHSIPSPTPGVSYQPDSGSGSLANFNTHSPNGDWTLFFADKASGGGSPSTLVSWGLEIEAVPEPVNVALGIFGGVFALIVVIRNPRLRNRLHCWRTAAVRWVDAV